MCKFNSGFASTVACRDWRGDDSIRDTIVRFYKKAKSVDQLAAFMEACNDESWESEDDYTAGESASAPVFVSSDEVDEEILIHEEGGS